MNNIFLLNSNQLNSSWSVTQMFGQFFYLLFILFIFLFIFFYVIKFINKAKNNNFNAKYIDIIEYRYVNINLSLALIKVGDKIILLSINKVSTVKLLEINENDLPQIENTNNTSFIDILNKKVFKDKK